MIHQLLSSLLKITRFWNLMILALTQYFTAGFLISAETIDDPRLSLLILSTVMIAAAGYIINDYYDVKIDLINKPDRVVIGKGLPRRYALLFHTLLSLSGVVLGLLLDWKIGAMNFLCAFLLWLYSNALKRLPFIGNFTVGLLTGISVLLVNLLYFPIQLMVVIYAVFAFIITLVREVIKDIEDLKGDNTFGCKTLPIVLGIRRTKYIIYMLLCLFAVLILALNKWVTPLPMKYFSLALFIPIVILTGWLVRADTIKDFYYLSQFCKLIMLVGIASMVFL